MNAISVNTLIFNSSEYSDLIAMQSVSLIISLNLICRFSSENNSISSSLIIELNSKSILFIFIQMDF